MTLHLWNLATYYVDSVTVLRTLQRVLLCVKRLVLSTVAAYWLVGPSATASYLLT